MPSAVGPSGMPVLAAQQNRAPYLAPGSKALEIEQGWWAYHSSNSENIDKLRWNQIWPYELIVLETDAKGSYTPKPGWRYTMPIPPDQLTISMPLASEVSATLGGVVEEHGGAPFRMISGSGTTGVAPLRGAAWGDVYQLTSLAPLVAPVIPAGTISTLESALAPDGLHLGIIPAQAGKNEDFLRGTGYHQWRLMQLFVERWAALKMTAEGRHARLALCCWKDQAVYLISLRMLDVTRSSSKALSYQWRIQAKAYRRINLDAIRSQNIDLLGDVSGLNALVGVSFSADAILGLRRRLAALSDVGSSLVSDFDRNVSEPFRQINILVNNDLAENTVGLAYAPPSILAQMGNSWRAAVGDLNAGALDSAAEGTDRSTREASLLGAPPTLDETNPLRVFESPLIVLKSTARPAAIDISPELRRAFLQDIQRVRAQTREDLVAQQNILKRSAAEYAARIGLGDTTVSELYGLPTLAQVRDPIDEDYEIMSIMAQGVEALDVIIAQRPTGQQMPAAIRYVESLARQAGVAFAVPSSKFAVPMPYGVTLEGLAQRYLGNANRWHEIATLNGLIAPYIDEVGTSYQLLADARHSTVLIPADVFVVPGQIVALYSDIRSRRAYRVLSVKRTADSTAIELDESVDALFKVVNRAYLHAYRPNTINSSQQIWIPSPTPIDGLTNPRIPGIDQARLLLERGGVDILLSKEGDFVVPEDGTNAWAIGIQNMVQRAKIRLSIPLGSWIGHPDVGLAIVPGTSHADLNARELLERATKTFESDPDFAGVVAASVSVRGPVAQQSLQLGILGSDQLVPISYEVSRTRD